MQQITYAPPNEPEQVWDLDEENLTAGQIITIEDALDLTFEEVNTLLQKGSIKALVVFVWVLRKQNEPGLTLDEVKQMKIAYIKAKADEAEVPKDLTSEESTGSEPETPSDD